MKIYIVVTDVVNDVTYSRKSVNTGVIQELMTMDPYLGKYNQTWYDLIRCMWTHMSYIIAENFVLLSWLHLKLCSFEYGPLKCAWTRKSNFLHIFVRGWGK